MSSWDHPTITSALFLTALKSASLRWGGSRGDAHPRLAVMLGAHHQPTTCLREPELAAAGPGLARRAEGSHPPTGELAQRRGARAGSGTRQPEQLCSQE